MIVGVHADAAGHRIGGGVGLYVRRLVAELLGSPDGLRYRLLVSRAAELPPEWRGAEVADAGLPLRPLYASWNLLRRPVQRGLDVVHATGLVIPPAPGAALVATVHDDTVDRFPGLVPPVWRLLYRRGLRLALREAAVLCTNSAATRDRLLDRYGIEPGRVVVTPFAPAVTPDTPPDASVLDRLGLRGVAYVLHVSTLEPRKNQVRLVRAFARADLPDHRLVLAGARGWGADEVLRAIGEAGLGERVTVTGGLGERQLAALYASAGAFAMPSLYEGFGMPLAEALAFGVPSVSSTDEALAEVGGDAALRVHPEDVDGLARALERLCRDEELRARLREAGPRVASAYSWERTAERTREAYRLAAGVRAP